jgi:hypothetical protein
MSGTNAPVGGGGARSPRRRERRETGRGRICIGQACAPPRLRLVKRMGERAAARASRKAISVPPGGLLSHLTVHPCHLRAGRGTSDRTGAATRLLQAGGTFPAAFAGRPRARQERTRPDTAVLLQNGVTGAVTRQSPAQCLTAVPSNAEAAPASVRSGQRSLTGAASRASPAGRPANVPGVEDTLSRIPGPRPNRASHPAWIAALPSGRPRQQTRHLLS